MEYSFKSGDEIIYVEHLPERKLLYSRTGAFKTNLSVFNYWKTITGQKYSTQFGANAYQLFGKPIGNSALGMPLQKAIKQNLEGKHSGRPPVSLAPVFRMKNGEITGMLHEYIIKFRRPKKDIPYITREKLGNWILWNTIEPIWAEKNCYVVRSTRQDLNQYFDGISSLNNFDNDVEYALPNFVGKLCLCTNDPNYSGQWAINPNANVNGFVPNLTINIESVWSRIGPENLVLNPVSLMVLDQGIFTHNDIQYKNSPSTTSTLSHGLKVTGVLGALQNQTGTTGISPKVSQALSTAFEITGQNFPPQFDVIASAQMAVDQATWVRDFLRTVRNAPVKPKVLNMSFNILGFPGTRILKSVIEDLSNDMLICVAAGNYINDGMHGLEDVPGYPAYLPDIVLPVGAIDTNGDRVKITPTNNWASKYNFPGNNGIMAPGVNIWTTDKNGGMDQNFNGTSAATAFVSGVAALLFSLNKNPNLKPSDMRNILLSTAGTSKLKTTDPKFVGKGLIDATAAMNHPDLMI